MSKNFLLVLAAIVIIFLGVLVVSNSSNKSSNVSTNTLTEHIEGQGKDGVSLVEYGDYQCPYCGEYYNIVKEVAAQYNQQITFQFRNFPLTTIHPNAFAGARAAEAAAQQGKFWQMHDLLYEANVEYYASNDEVASWISASSPLSYFDGFAKQLGLNETKFNTDYNSPKINDLVDADMAEGNKLGIDATPTFYLDGKKFLPQETLSSFESYINAAIAQKTKTATKS